MDKNSVVLSGVLAGAPRYMHDRYGEKMYEAYVKVKRTSGTEDVLPVHLGEYTLARRLDAMEKGAIVRLEGELRRYATTYGEEVRTRLCVFARKMQVLAERGVDENQVELEGVICRAPYYHITSLGREICEFPIRVTRGYQRYSAVSVLAWGRMAQTAKTLEVGDRVQCAGRLQHRQYEKQLQDSTVANLTVYEVSLQRLALQGGTAD